ncbi:glutamine--tRNA ligase/YqeY domain fusion protein [Rosettibacter firmus]|uniref:glutamine--tRNA ligase/YqeY domain fusion protein n=1 Tax=Rosettibacter firmus TaxID=3111522 RepID=UPI00336BF50C
MDNKNNINDKPVDKKPKNFIYEIIDEDIKNNRWGGRVHTRFPPEPNGYLHIGHAKAICLNYGIAKYYGGKFNLRFDDTNPEKEDTEYVNSIIEDVKWLGADFEDRLFFASDYFEQMYQWAIELIKKGKAYVCDLSAEEIRATRGTLTEPGIESPYRNRSIEENLDLFERMRKGEFPDGSKTLRAKIDMSSPNLNMRDPVMYRIIHQRHHRQGDKWCIYPTYDWAHGLEDSIEGITHSICTLEFENHRPLYDWFLDELGIYHPQQIEFARLNLSYTVMSKRKLLELVQKGIVDGWDDPRMPTISGLRRRGYTPEAIWKFTEMIGVAKRDALTDVSLLEYAIREDLNKTAQRAMAVLNPLKVVITNYNGEELLDAINNPENPDAGTRKIPFSNEIYIESTDFMENPPKGYHRLMPGGEVRLRYAYIIKCEEVIKNEKGEIVELRCTYDPETKSGTGTSNKKVKGVIHWVSAKHCFDAEVRLYDRLFNVENPGELDNWLDYINPNSLEIIPNAKLEPFLQNAKPLDKFQFERLGYFCVDPKYSKDGKLVFNRTVTLKDTWAKIAAKSSS